MQFWALLGFGTALIAVGGVEFASDVWLAILALELGGSLVALGRSTRRMAWPARATRDGLQLRTVVGRYYSFRGDECARVRPFRPSALGSVAFDLDDGMTFIIGRCPACAEVLEPE